MGKKNSELNAQQRQRKSLALQRQADELRAQADSYTARGQPGLAAALSDQADELDGFALKAGAGQD